MRPDRRDFLDVLYAGLNGRDRPSASGASIQPQLDMVINLRTAQALSLTIPASLLQRADQVIE